jgi:hypothetical protein
MQLESDKPMSGWGLILSIPTPGVTGGRLSVDVGGRLQKIDLAYNQAATRQIVANPSHDIYRVVEVLPRFGPLDARLIKECDGLRHGCTAFGHITRAKKLIRRASEIFPGQDYVLIWHSDEAPNIPERFDAVRVAADKRWEGSIISLPRYLEEAEHLWLLEHIGLPIKNALPTIVPVWPPLFDRHTSQLLEAPSHSQFLFAVDSLEGHEAAVFFRTQGQDEVVNVHNIPSAILRVPSSQAQEFKIVARARNEAEVLVNLTMPLPNWRPGGITLIFQEGDSRSSFSICDTRTTHHVNATRNGHMHLVASSGPKYCKVKVREHVRGLWVPYKDVECDAKDIAALLTTIFESNSTALQFDFGAYGHLLVDRVCPSHKAAQMPPKLRNLILGYLFQYPHTPSFVLIKDGMDDESLIAAFRRVRPTRQSLAQHVALAKSIDAIAT